MPLGSFRLNGLAVVPGVTAQPRPATWSNNGSVDTVTGKFNTGLRYNLANEYSTLTLAKSVTTSNSTPVTIEFWMYIDTSSFGSNNKKFEYGNLFYMDGGTDGCRIWAGGSFLTSIGSSQNTWHHFVFQNDDTSSTWYAWRNGFRYSFSGGRASTNTMKFGMNFPNDGGGGSFTRVDEIRVSGITRYDTSGGITVPTSEFTNDADTLALFRCEDTSQSDTTS